MEYAGTDEGRGMRQQQSSSRGKGQRQQTLLSRLIRQVRLVSTGVLLAQTAIVVDVQASPAGGQIVGGSGGIEQSGSQTVIQQNSQNLAINWQSFNLSATDSVQFLQPSSSATALNRILDQNPTLIQGLITANGKVFLINASGIIFGKTAVVNVGSLVATSLDMSVDDFMAGRYDLSAVTGSDGIVVNRGLIEAASGGSVSLVGQSVVNEGIIVADLGQVNLGAGSKATLDFDGDGLIRFEITDELLENVTGGEDAVRNSGVIQANGGQVLLTASAARDVFTNVVNNEGVIRANRIENQGGVVRLVGTGGNTIHSGEIDVSGQDAVSTGGTVHVLGDNVGLLDDSSIDASGAAGGGTVLIGGDYQGGNPDIRNASATFVSADSSIKADATADGDGGKVIVWADNTTRVYGSISARGGASSGDGGFVETSGKYLDVTRAADVGASNGDGGTWLLDPEDVLITNASANMPGGLPSNTDPGPDVFAPVAADTVTTIDVATINAALDNGTNVDITTASAGTTTTGTITLDAAAAISKTADGGNGDGSTLTMVADDAIVLNGTIASSAGVLNVDLQATNAVQVNNTVNTNGGTFSASGSSYSDGTPGAGGNAVTASSVAISVSGGIDATTVTGSVAAESTVAGDIRIDNTGALDVTAVGGVTGISTTTGNIVITSDDTVTVTQNIAAATGGTVEIDTSGSAGDIVGAGGTVSSDTGITLNAGGGIGIGGALNTDTTGGGTLALDTAGWTRRATGRRVISTWWRAMR